MSFCDYLLPFYMLDGQGEKAGKQFTRTDKKITMLFLKLKS